jgi:hypothetical protein
VQEWLAEPDRKGRIRGLVSNTVKLEKWVEILTTIPDNDTVIFTDCDMLFLKDPGEVFSRDFDIAYTERTQSKWTINGGVLFVKVNPRSRDFMNHFVNVNKMMFEDPDFHQPWKNKYAGMNQSALGCILEMKKHEAKLISLPCAEYNSCGEDWPFITEKTRILHIKGQLRKILFNPSLDEGELTTAAGIWRKAYEELICSI